MKDPIRLLITKAHSSFGETIGEQRRFIEDNITKHTRVQWINFLLLPFIIMALCDTAKDQLPTVVQALLAPVMVMGAGWFAISFGAIPAKYIKCSMKITFWMYLAFIISLTTMLLAIGFIVSPWLFPVLGLIYIAIQLSCIPYDAADGLKAGLDVQVMRHALGALAKLRQEGIEVNDEGEVSSTKGN